jgi:hypothetical protein
MEFRLGHDGASRTNGRLVGLRQIRQFDHQISTITSHLLMTYKADSLVIFAYLSLRKKIEGT